MSDMQDETRPDDAADAGSVANWLERMEEIGDEAGYFEPLGPDHFALFDDAGTTLLVTFEPMAQIRGQRDDQLPWGMTLARPRGWSSLCIVAQSETWYRHPAVYGYFDRLVDDAFFEDFDRVVFYGAGPGAYAAAAFSVTAPGATAILVQPAASLAPDIASWDPRHVTVSGLSFTDRYGYAPDMVEGAGEVFVIYDPHEAVDAKHAELFDKPFVTPLRCPHLGGQIEGVLTSLGVLPQVIAMACEGSFTSAEFWPLYRARRAHAPYLRTLLSRLDAANRPLLAALLCRNVTQRIAAAPRFRRRLSELEDDLMALGIGLPPTRAKPAQSPPAS